MKEYKKQAAPVLLMAVLLAVWEGAVRIYHIPLYVLPSPVEVLEALKTEAAVLAGHAVVTVLEALAGIGIAFVLAIGIGIAMDRFPAVKRSVYPLLVVTQTVPMLSLIHI